MARLRRNFASGTITDNPLLIGATTITSAAFANLPVVASPDTLALVLDPLAQYGNPEIVYVTAHTTSATTVTASRGQETALGGYAARAHQQGTAWIVAETATSAYEKMLLGTSSARPGSPTTDMILKETDTGYVRQYNGTNWVHMANLRMFAWNAAVAGGTPPAVDGAPAAPFYFQGGTIVIQTDGAGVFTVPYPTPFPNGVVTNLITPCQPGAGFAHPMIYDPGGGQTVSGFGVKVFDAAGNAMTGFNSRYNWLAIGW